MASVFLKKYDSNFNKFFTKSTIRISYQDLNIPYTNFLLNQSLVFVNSLNFSNVFFFNFLKKNYINQTLFLMLNFTNFFFFFELSYLNYKNNVNIHALFNCFFTNTMIVYLLKTQNNTIDSLSYLYPSSVWAERELKEMTSVFVTGLKDSRRLLTDYFEKSKEKFEYKTASYNLRLQTILKKCYIDYLFFVILLYVYL